MTRRDARRDARRARAVPHHDAHTCATTARGPPLTLAAWCSSPPQEELNAMVDEIDADGNGEIDFDGGAPSVLHARARAATARPIRRRACALTSAAALASPRVQSLSPSCPAR